MTGSRRTYGNLSSYAPRWGDLLNTRTKKYKIKYISKLKLLTSFNLPSSLVNKSFDKKCHEVCSLKSIAYLGGKMCIYLVILKITPKLCFSKNDKNSHKQIYIWHITGIWCGKYAFPYGKTGENWYTYTSMYMFMNSYLCVPKHLRKHTYVCINL